MESLLNIIPRISLEEIIYYLFGFICHQDKTILTDIGGHMLPLCPRCLGLHTGFFITLLLPALLSQKLMRIDIQRYYLVIIFLVSLTGIHWFLGFINIIKMDFTYRILTGLISGAALGVLMKLVKNKYLKQKPAVITKLKILYTCLAIILFFTLLQTYEFLLLTILVAAITNIISVIMYLLRILYLIQTRNILYEMNKEVQS